MRTTESRIFLPEDTLLSVLAMEASHVDRAIDRGLRVEMFEGAEASSLFQAMCQASALEQAVDEATVFTYVDSRTEPLRLYMNSIYCAFSTSSNFGPLVEEVIGRWRRRQLSNHAKLISLQIAEVLKQPEEERWALTKEWVEPHIEKMVNVLNDVQEEHTLAQQTDEAWREAELRLSGKADAGGLSTGFPAFDTAAWMIRAHELWILAAGTSIGKSTLAVQWAARLAEAGKHVAFFTFEMGAGEVIERIAIHRSGTRWSDVSKHPANRAALRKAFNELRESPFLRIYDKIRSIEQIEAKCRLLKAAGKLDAYVIDYLQLVDPPKEAAREKREVQVSSISRRLKALCRTLHVPGMVLSQFNRDFLKEGRPPRIYDLRESGALEQDADRIWLMHMPAETKDGMQQTDETETVEIIVDQAKCRGGPRPSCRLVLKRPLYTFSWPVQAEKAEQADMGY